MPEGTELGPVNGGVQVVINDPDDPPRAAWDNKVQFMLSIIGYSVGLGNIWRFPYLCQQNGGGAFLIPFGVMLILEGIPLFLIELGMGQKMRLGALGVWNNVHPWLGGLGVASATVTFFVSLYYNVIITWCIYYLFSSLNYPLPWAECPKLNNGTEVVECTKASETAYFWYRTTLDISPNMDDSGGIKWWIALCLFIAWTSVFFIVMKGIQSSGKVVWFTSLFPYIVLTIFFIRGLTLKGASAGLVHMYTPKVEKLYDPNVWLDAATQVFYSFGLAFGSLIAFGSYNPPKNNCVRDVILVSVCNAITAIYASLVVFAILGFKAMLSYDKCLASNRDRLGVLTREETTQMGNLIHKIDNLEPLQYPVLGFEACDLSKNLDQAAEGTGLAFIVFAQAIVELPMSPFWSILFFTMLLSLGIGSQIGILEGMLCTIFDIDFFKRISKPYLTGAVCVTCFFMGLIFCTGAGQYWLGLFDSFAGTIGLVMIALLETIAVVYIYGHEKFTNDIYEMTGHRPGLYWQVTWRFIGPVIMTVILSSSVIAKFVKTPTYMAWDKDKGVTVEMEYPAWVLGIAIAIVLATVLPIILVFILRRFQILKFDVDIHQGAIRRIDTTVSTKEMMADVDLDEYDSNEEDEEEEEIGNRLGVTTTGVNNRSSGGTKGFKMEAMEF